MTDQPAPGAAEAGGRRPGGAWRTILAVAGVAGLLGGLGLVHAEVLYRLEAAAHAVPAAPELLEARGRSAELAADVDAVIALGRAKAGLGPITGALARLDGRLPAIRAERILEIGAAIRSACRHDHHQPVVHLYDQVLGLARARGYGGMPLPAIHRMYDDLIWLARNHGEGLDRSVRIDDVLGWFAAAEEHAVADDPANAVHFFFEHAMFLGWLGRVDDVTVVLEQGLGHLGRNQDRDGSLLHELGLQRMRLAHRSGDDAQLEDAVRCFDRAILAKRAAGNAQTPLYSGKMRLEALSELASRARSRERLAGLAAEYDRLIGAWVAAEPTIDPKGLRAMSEVYIGAALAQAAGGRAEVAIARLDEARRCVERYESGDARKLRDIAEWQERLRR